MLADAVSLLCLFASSSAMACVSTHRLLGRDRHGAVLYGGAAAFLFATGAVGILGLVLP
jgi:hypothetical protein